MKPFIYSLLGICFLFIACSKELKYDQPELNINLAFVDDDSTMLIKDAIKITPDYNIHIYPNPFISYLNMDIPQSGTKKIMIVHENGKAKVFDIDEGNNTLFSFDGSFCEQGYLYIEIL